MIGISWKQSCARTGKEASSQFDVVPKKVNVNCYFTEISPSLLHAIGKAKCGVKEVLERQTRTLPSLMK